VPTIQYPLDQAVAPLNLPAIETQWTAGSNDLFHVSYKSTYAQIDAYTTDVQATLDEGTWTAIAGTAAGDSLAITVEGLQQAAPAMKFASAAVALNLSHDTIDTTALYYWASSKGSIMSQVFGSTDQPTVVQDNCTACHSLSRSGTRLGYSRCTTDGGCQWAGFLRYDPIQGWTEVVDASNDTIHGSYTTFNPPGVPFPDDTQAVALVTMSTGQISMYNPDTGIQMTNTNIDGMSVLAPSGSGSGHSALMPDWSIDGSTILYSSTPHTGQWVDLDNGSIATMSYSYDAGSNYHTFGAPKMIVQEPRTLPSGSYTNLFFPSFSPDMQLIVFNAARSTWRNTNAGQGATPGQRLMLASADGSSWVDLTAMNGSGDLDTTWPHWAPGSTSDYDWIAFSTERPYGHEITQANTAAGCIQNGVLECKQIWIGAISKAKLAAGMTMDPSSPPVWLPGQDTQADNLSPYWTAPPGLQ
jgi:hypothetical protein